MTEDIVKFHRFVVFMKCRGENWKHVSKEEDWLRVFHIPADAYNNGDLYASIEEHKASSPKYAELKRALRTSLKTIYETAIITVNKSDLYEAEHSPTLKETEICRISCQTEDGQICYEEGPQYLCWIKRRLLRCFDSTEDFNHLTKFTCHFTKEGLKHDVENNLDSIDVEVMRVIRIYIAGVAQPAKNEDVV